MPTTTPQYSRWVAITKSDTVNFDGTTASAAAYPVPCDAIYVGVAGTIAPVQPGGAVLALTAIAGSILPIQAVRVNATNTAASDCFALYV